MFLIMNQNDVPKDSDKLVNCVEIVSFAESNAIEIVLDENVLCDYISSNINKF